MAMSKWPCLTIRISMIIMNPIALQKKISTPNLMRGNSTKTEDEIGYGEEPIEIDEELIEEHIANETTNLEQPLPDFSPLPTKKTGYNEEEPIEIHSPHLDSIEHDIYNEAGNLHLTQQTPLTLSEIGDSIAQSDQPTTEIPMKTEPPNNQRQSDTSQATSPILRRSARISIRGSRASYAAGRGRTKSTRGRGPKANLEREARHEALIRALQDEAIAVKPLKDNQISDVHYRCGIAVGDPLPLTETNVAPTEIDVATQQDGDVNMEDYNQDESNLAALEYDSADYFSEEEENQL